MKKVIFLLMALLMSNAIKAQTISKDVVEQAKAIVAYEMNLLSLNTSKDDKKLIEDFKKCASKKLNIDDVKECLPTKFKNNKALCDAIKKLNSEFTNPDAIAVYYSDSIFLQKGGEIEKFVNKRSKKDVAQLKRTIKTRIKEVTDKTDILFAPEDKVSKEIAKKEEQGNTENNNKPLPEPTKDSSADETNSFMEILKKHSGYLLAFVVVVVAIILFKNSRSLEYECNDLKDDKERNYELLQKKIYETRELQNKIDQLKQKNSELEEQVRALQKDVENLEEARRKQMRLSSAAAISGAAREEKAVHNSPREYFLGIPEDGKFAEGSELYRPGKALYKVISNDGIYGEFEYINRPEAIGFAKQSRTSFLESACNIIGENKLEFAQIETKCKGKVERISDGWKIIKKADVCLV